MNSSLNRILSFLFFVRICISNHIKHSLKSLLHLMHKSTCCEYIFIQSQCSKVYFNETQALVASLQLGFAITINEPLYMCYCALVRCNVQKPLFMIQQLCSCLQTTSRLLSQCNTTIKMWGFCMSRIFDKKRSEPKIFLAYHLNSLCFSSI